MMKGSATHGVGRRKSSVARVYVKPGAGNITVNDRPYKEYFGRATLQMIIRQPLELLGLSEKYDIKVNVNGGGTAGQAGATRHAISRALVKIDESVKSPLKKKKLLTRDPREVERKKFGRHKARKRPQYSKR